MNYEEDDAKCEAAVKTKERGFCSLRLGRRSTKGARVRAKERLWTEGINGILNSGGIYEICPEYWWVLPNERPATSFFIF